MTNCSEKEQLHLNNDSLEYDLERTWPSDRQQISLALCFTLSISLCFTLFLILSLFIFLSSPPPTDSNNSAATCMHLVRWGQFVDDANSKVTLPLQMLRGYWKKARDARISSFIYILVMPHIYTHILFYAESEGRHAIPSIIKPCLRNNGSLTCIANVFVCVITSLCSTTHRELLKLSCFIYVQPCKECSLYP